MNFPRLARRIHAHLVINVACQREPDFPIGAASPGGVYLNRWYLSPWRRAYRNIRESQRTWWQHCVVAVSRALPNPYLHEFRRDDDDRAHHDHPSFAVTFLLCGSYVEHTIARGGIHVRKQYNAGSLRFLRLGHTHRIELLKDANGNPIPCWTLFMFGPVLRHWGFHCPNSGWVHWQKFTATDSPGDIGPGCGA